MEKNWRFHHAGIVTRDLDRVVEYYESCGIGPFEPESTMDPDTPMADFDIERAGKPLGKRRMRILKCDPVPILFEVIEPLEAESKYTDFLEKHGPGVEHIAFMVDDLEKEVAKLEEKGFPLLVSAKDSDGRLVYVHFDAGKFGSFNIQLMQEPKE